MFDGFIGEARHVAFNPMVLIEGGRALVIAFVCLGMRRLEPASTLLLVLPTFAPGRVTGTLNVPGDQSNFIWEASIWVLVLAVFVYGMRTSLFAVRGLTVGVMWESWCMGQMATRVLMLTHGSGALAIATLAAALVYLAAVIAQIAVAPVRYPAAAVAVPAGGDGPAEEAESDRPSDPYETLGLEFQLSQRELEVLRLLAEGRSAKYVSEELVISFNTARSHIRHIYEKLNVHSKQELISLMRGQEGREG